MTDTYIVKKKELKYAGNIYLRGERVELIGARMDPFLIGKYVMLATPEELAEFDNPSIELVIEPDQVDDEDLDFLTEAYDTRCTANTKAGNRCQRDRVGGTEFCGLHKPKD